MADLFAKRWDREYVYWKLRTDPLYPAAASALLEADDGDTRVLDIGCGLGLFALYLREAGFQGPIMGVDYDERKIAWARSRAGGSDRGLRFFQGDVRNALPEEFGGAADRGHVVILDVLQYLEPSEQESLLAAASSLVAPGACFVIRSGLAEASWRFRITRTADWFAHGCFWMKGRPVHYPDKRGLEALLRARGFEGVMTPLWGKTPFNNYLGIFKKQAD